MSILIPDLIGFASGEDKEMKCAAVTILALLSRSELTTAFFTELWIGIHWIRINQ